MSAGYAQMEESLARRRSAQPDDDWGAPTDVAEAAREEAAALGARLAVVQAKANELHEKRRAVADRDHAAHRGVLQARRHSPALVAGR